jgi:hypothetical protein
MWRHYGRRIRALRLKMHTIRMLPRAALAAMILAACAPGDEDHFVRGHGLRVASLDPEVRVAVYEAALAASFELRDPALTLVLDRRMLPRAGGMAEDGRVPAAIESGLKQRGVIHGVCEPPITVSRKTPLCPARGPGYVVRFSDVLRRGGDSVEVYVAVQKFDTPSSGASESLRFEKAYQLVRRGDAWDAIREARVRETAPELPGAQGVSATR